MRASLLCSLFFSLLFATPVAARQAQILSFEPADTASVPERTLKPAIADNPTDPSGVGASLADDFRMLSIGAPQPGGVSLATTISIPAWMRTGRVTTAPAVELPIMAIGRSACGAAPYRPRSDLGLLAETRRFRLFPIVAQIACEEGVPAGLFDALIVQESRYNTAAVSPKGALGLAQLMPATAEYLGVSNPWEPIANLRGGARYLRSHLVEFKRVDLALAAYNAGPGRVRRLGRIPAFAETQNYVAAITRGWAAFNPRMATVIAASPMAAPSRRSGGKPARTVHVLAYEASTASVAM